MPDFITNITAKDNASSTINKVKDGFKSIGDSTKDLERIKTTFDKITTSTKPVKKQLQELQALMVNMNVKGLTNTDVFTEVAQKAGELKDAMADARQAVNAYADDTFKIQATADAFSGVASVISLSTSAMALFGKENKDVERTLLKVQAAMGVMNSVQQIANLLNKDSAVMLRLKQIRMEVAAATQAKLTTATVAGTAAEVASNTVTKTGTVVQTAWNAAKAIAKALMGDFTGLLLVGAGVMATYAVATASSADNVEELGKKQANTNNIIAEANKKIASTAGDLVGTFMALKTQWEACQNSMQKNKFLDENGSKFKSMGLEIDDVNELEELFTRNTSAVVSALKARAQAEAWGEIYKEKLKQKLQKDLNGSVANGRYYKTAKAGSTDYSEEEAKAAGINSKVIQEYEKETGQTVQIWTKKKLSAQDAYRLNIYRNIQALNKQKGETDELNAIENKMTESVKNQAVAYSKLDKSLTSSNKKNKGGGGTNKNVHTNAKEEQTELEKLEQKVKDLEKVRADIDIEAPNAKEKIDEINKKIKDAKLDVLHYKIAVGIEIEPSELDEMEDQLKQYKLYLRMDIPQEEKDKVYGLIQDLEKNIEKKKIEYHIIPDPKEKEAAEAKKKLEDLFKEEGEIEFKPKVSSFEKAIGKQDEPKTEENKLEDIQNQMDFNDRLIETLKKLQAAYAALGDAGVEGYTRIQGAIDEVTKSQEKLGEEGTVTNKKIKKQEKLEKTLNGIGDAAQQTGSLLGQMAEATDSKELKGAALVAEAVANIMLGFAQASAQSASLGPAWPFWLAASLAAVGTVIATIHSISGFANGGIIGGKTTIGDYNLARVNKGEMILNTRQQENLFKMIDSGRMNNGANAGGRVVFELKGKKLQGVLNNYGDTMKKLR